MWFHLFLILFFHSAFCEIKVKITEGTLKGQILNSRDGRPYYSFTGIPYAKPPIGNLRFENRSIGGTLDATKDSNICTQKYEVNSQEDCLYLNVYTPSTEGNFLVMFWIHVGGFFMGHNNRDMYGPDYFMDNDVVLVSANYRLGALGFMSAEDDVLPGNYGLKDQVMALQWVRENVVKFGGDPGKVTIFGGSSGGVSVGYHLLSPMSKGLFHKAILQSGTPMCRWSTSLPGVARNRSETIFDMAGCVGKTSEDRLKCLKTLPASFFEDVHERLREWQTYPAVLFSPVLKRCDSGQEAFLCTHHLYRFKQESFVPSIIGLNSAEGEMAVASLYNDTSLIYSEFLTDFSHLISIIMSYQHYTYDLNNIGQKIFKKYYPSGNIEDHSHMQTVQMITDGRFLHGIFDMAFKLSSPVYFYLHDYQNEFSYNSMYGKCNKNLGTFHGDELISVFKTSFVIPKELNVMHTKVSKLLVKIWSTFASSEIPTIDGTEEGSKWPEFNLQSQKIIFLNSDNPLIIQNPLDENYKFWNEMPLLSNLNKIMSKNELRSKYIEKEL